jgi:hypothetical protein
MQSPHGSARRTDSLTGEVKTLAENSAGIQRGRPFPKGTSGNPAGKPRSARHRATRAAELLLDGEAGNLTRKAIELAKEGDTTALRLCLERIFPPRKDRPVTFAMPEIASANDAAKLMASILAAVASGSVTPHEASVIAHLVETYAKTLEITEIERRLAALEGEI